MTGCWCTTPPVPAFRPGCVGRLIAELGADPVGGLLAVPVADTLKRAGEPGAEGCRAAATVPRDGLWQAQTPQLFRYRLLLDALHHCLGLGMVVTDEAQAIEALGWQAQVVEGSRRNIKITRPEDLALAEFFLGAE